MNRSMIAMSLISALILGSAQAGTVTTVPVYVSPHFAYGSVSTARHSSDQNQSIGCGVYGTSTHHTYVYCSAHDAAGHSMYCATYDPAINLVQAVQSVNATSNITIDSDASYSCTLIYASNFSMYL